MKNFIVILAAFLLIAVASMAIPALATPDDIYFTVANGTQRCITILLPDDSGWSGSGDFEYTMTMTPGKDRTWSDFSGITSRKISENNTNQIPICFSRKNSNTTCADAFTLTISAPAAGVTRVIHGGACESSIAGVSTSPASPGQSVGSSLNSNYGLFDASFSQQTYYASPNQTVPVTIIASSYQAGASLHLTLWAGLGSVSPASIDTSFGAAGGQKELVFNVQAPSSGNITLALTTSFSGCTAQGCLFTKNAELVVGSQPSQTGYRVQLFPVSISTARNKPAQYTLVIYNNGIARQFNISTAGLYGIEGGLDTSVSAAADSNQSVQFNMTPTGGESSYEFLITIVSSDGNNKGVTGYVNVDGMEAGAQRAVEFVEATGNSSAANQANRAYNNFQANASLDNYGNLQDELDRLGQTSQTPAIVINNSRNTTPPPYQTNLTPQTNQGGAVEIFGKDMWILIVIVGCLFAVSIFFFLKKGKQAGKEEFEYGAGNMS